MRQAASPIRSRTRPLVRVSLFAMLAVMLAGNVGCRKIRQKMEEKAAEEAIKAGTGGAVSVNNGDNGGVTVQDNKGNVVTFGDTKVPADWPSSVPLYPKGKVTSAISSKENGKNAHVVGMETTDSADTVFAFFKSKLTGFEQQSEMSSKDTHMLVVQDKKTKMNVTVIIGVSGTSTTVQVAATQG